MYSIMSNKTISDTVPLTVFLHIWGPTSNYKSNHTLDTSNQRQSCAYATRFKVKPINHRQRSRGQVLRSTYHRDQVLQSTYHRGQVLQSTYQNHKGQMLQSTCHKGQVL